MKTTKSKVTIGLDLGDRKHVYCVLGSSAEVVKEGSIANRREELAALAAKYPGALVIMECGTHSPWVSRYLSEQGLRVLVANPRKVRAIHQNERKSDRRDSEMLARIGRMDPRLLHPIAHGSEQAQRDLLQIKLRDSLVRGRVSLINSVRATLKSLGYQVSNPSSAHFHKKVLTEIPTECAVMVEPIVAAIAEITERIRELERAINQMIKERYPQAARLQQIIGIGPITSLYFVLRIENPSRFASIRDVGPFLGLCPKRDQSGDCDKQLPISKAGDKYLRRLLVNAAQYVIGPFGKPCALREQGLKLVAGGSSREKKRAVIAIARKLAVLMLSLWQSGNDYEPYPAKA